MGKTGVIERARSASVAENVFKWWDYPLFILLTVASYAVILYFFWYWLSVEDWRYDPISFWLMLFLLMALLANNQGRWFLLPLMKRPRPMAPRDGWKVAVTTTFVPGAESLEMLEDTLRALVALDYPHDTWVLDEGDDTHVRALCLRLGAHHFSRKHMPRYQTETGIFQSQWKHGNYNAWLWEIGFDRYDLITVFDPDHVPVRSFLLQVLGYFNDPKIAYVQVAQAYYNQAASFIARGAAEEVYAFYSSVQMAGYGLGYPVVIGGHTTHRVAALKPVGGFPPHNADDVLITLQYRAAGWHGVYVPHILARGLTPVDWNGYLIQQWRWARSILDIKLRVYPKMFNHLSSSTRVMSFLHGLSYLQKSLIIVTGLLLVSLMLATGSAPKVLSYPTLPALGLMYLVLQVCEFYRQRFYLDWRQEWGVHWRVAALQYAKWPYLLLALVDVLSHRRVPFALTQKVKSSPYARLFWPHMMVVTLICAAWIIGMMSGRAINPLLHGCAALIVAGSLALILTEHLRFLDPYDRDLRAQWRMDDLGETGSDSNQLRSRTRAAKKTL